MKKDYLSIMVILLLCCAANYAALVKDQYQESNGYGLAIGAVTRWQDFVPAYDNLAQIELEFYRWGGSGLVEINVKDNGESQIWNGTITDTSIPSLELKWVSILLDTPIALDPGQTYRIELVGGQWSGGGLNWMGSQESTYDLGQTDYSVETFDYAFRTYAEVIPEPMTLSLFLFGSFMLRKKQQC